MEPREVDERRHQPGEGPWWRESWSFSFADGAGLGGYTELTLFPAQNRSWYRCVLARLDQPLLVIEDLGAPLPRQDLELKSEGLWADHICEAPMRQWTVANEAYAVALDDAEEAIGRGYGVPTPVAFDLEWYATGRADAPADAPVELLADGYRQSGEVHAVIELPGGPLSFVARAWRDHRWGPFVLPDIVEIDADANEAAPAQRVPWRLPSPFDAVVEDVLTSDGWHRHRR